MKILLLMVVLLGLASAAQLKRKLHTQTETKDIDYYENCDKKRQDILNQECTTVGQSDNAICNKYKEDLEAKLSCSDTCEDFYQAYNKQQIRREINKYRYYRAAGDKENEVAATNERRMLVNQEGNMISNACQSFPKCYEKKNAMVNSKCTYPEEWKSCNSYKSELTQTLNCKTDTCESFHRKYNQAVIARYTKISESYKSNKKMSESQRVAREATALKTNEDSYVAASCPKA